MPDPLEALPAEIVLRIIDFTPTSSTASLLRTSRSWHAFVDTTHQDIIFSSPSKTPHPHGARDFSFLSSSTSFARYFDGVTSWKELCRRQTLLARNWSAENPVSRESVIQVGNDPVWRFRADFRRRWIVSTSHRGGVVVTDMDTGLALWGLGKEEVRPHAHLEYDAESGTAVWDRWGNAVEVWRVDEGEGIPRGTFRLVKVLTHDVETRGYQLSYGALCVVSTEGVGFVYDMTGEEPVLKTRMEIEHEAVGHLDQNEDVVMYSMGKRGYHIYEKDTGKLVGKMDPLKCSNAYHIIHPDPPLFDILTTARHHIPRLRNFGHPLQYPRRDRFASLWLEEGPHPDAPIPIEEEEWGAGMLSGDVMVGVSNGGSVFICTDWRGSLKSLRTYNAHCVVIGCEPNDNITDLGSWLSVRNDRILFEVHDLIYILTLPDIKTQPWPQLMKGGQNPIYAISQSSTPQIGEPVSFMAAWDDCIMFTYTTLGVQLIGPNESPLEINGIQHRARMFPTKAICTVSLAPSLDGETEEHVAQSEEQQMMDDAADRISRPATASEVFSLSGVNPVVRR